MKLFSRKYASVGHWLSYNGKWLIVGILAVVFLIFASRPSGGAEPDYIISWVGSTQLSAAEESAVERAVSQAGADQNGDGKVTVSIVQYPIDFRLPPEDYRYQDTYSNTFKLLAEIQDNTCYLFLLEDPERFQSVTGVLQYLDGTWAANEDGFESENWERMCARWEPEGLERTAYLARRSFFGEADSSELFPGGDELFLTLTN